jgi:hypothetical protein
MFSKPNTQFIYPKTLSNIIINYKNLYNHYKTLHTLKYNYFVKSNFTTNQKITLFNFKFLNIKLNWFYHKPIAIFPTKARTYNGIALEPASSFYISTDNDVNSTCKWSWLLASSWFEQNHCETPYLGFRS